jgi:hypothetical protein
MKTHRYRMLALILLAATCCWNALAQSSLWLTHDSSWRIEGRELVIETLAINNPNGAEESGPLFLSIYAQPGAAYDGGVPGQLLGRAPIESIPAGGRVENVSVRTRVRAARPGFKFTALMLERQNGKKYEIVDWVAFTSLYAFPRKQNGGVGSQDTAIGIGDIAVSGGAMTLTGRRAEITVQRIQSQRELTRTGTLRLAIYASATPYGGGVPDGQLLATRVLGELAPGDYFRDLSAKLLLKKPRPRGEYYITMLVEEEQESGWMPVGFAAEVGPQLF